MAEFLDFKEISQRIPFSDVLDYLNIPYTSIPLRKKTRYVQLL